MMSEEDLYQIVVRAQNGDREALRILVDRFHPAIRKVSQNRKKQEQADVEQDTVVLVIKTILTYDLSRTPGFSQFCSNIEKRLS